MADWTFHPRFVSPFYMQLIGGNLAALAPPERAALHAEFHARAAEITEPELLEMLRSSWRPATVAAWFIAARRGVALQVDLERFLVARPAHVAPMCLCLAHLGGDSARDALSGYVQGCTDGSLHMQPCDDSLTPEWALCAWSHLTGEAPQARWTVFVDAEIGGLEKIDWYRSRPHFLTRQRDGWNARFAAARAALPQMLAFVGAAG